MCISSSESNNWAYFVSFHSVSPVHELFSAGGAEEIGAVVDTNVEPKLIKFM